MNSVVQKRSVMDIPLFHKAYDLYKLLHTYQSRIPKGQRYSLWLKCENTALLLIETILQIGHSRDAERVERLYDLSCHIDLIKVFVRIMFLTGKVKEAKPLMLIPFARG
jgi:hypothetical protein